MRSLGGDTEAEILKLAQLLHRDPEQLSYLENVAPADLRMLREQITERLFTAQEGALRRLVAASKLLPAGLVANLGQTTFGPMLSARIAGLLDPDRAVDIASRMPSEFLAEVAVELDPRRASAVIAGIPAERISEITGELARREDYVTMGRFVGHLGDEALGAALAALDDDALEQTVFVLEDGGGDERVQKLLGEWRSAAASRRGRTARPSPQPRARRGPPLR
ncbi:MAG TPA: hypothetical protein VGI50_12190 [Solirubrobacteraceae bacterium]